MSEPFSLKRTPFISGVNGTQISVALDFPHQQSALLPGDLDIQVLPLTSTLGIATVRIAMWMSVVRLLMSYMSSAAAMLDSYL